MLTWCDGVSNVDLAELLAFHRSPGKLVTMTVVRAPSRFGFVEIGSGQSVRRFTEKPDHGDGWLTGAFFVLEPPVFDYIAGDDTLWERDRKSVVEGQSVSDRVDTG